jgi:hypothetical protein
MVNISSLPVWPQIKALSSLAVFRLLNVLFPYVFVAPFLAALISSILHVCGDRRGRGKGAALRPGDELPLENVSARKFR